MNYREQFYEGEIDGKTLLDVIDEKEAEAQALRDDLQEEREISASLLGKYDALEAEANGLREELARINSLANCGSVRNWLTLSDEDKAKWFELYCRMDSENVELRRDAERYRWLRDLPPDSPHEQIGNFPGWMWDEAIDQGMEDEALEGGGI